MNNYKTSSPLNLCRTFAFLLIMMLMPFSSVQADEEEGTSTTQHIAFMFYKMTGLTPDYDRWVEEFSKREIHKYGELGKRDYLTQTRNKLQAQFMNTNPKTQTITVTEIATLEALPIDPKDPDSDYFINTYFDQSPPFIAKRLPDRNVQVIVPKLEDAVKMVMSGQDFKRMNELFYDGVKEKNRIMLKLYLKPVAADADKPVLKGNKKFYLLLTELQEFEIYNDIGRDKFWPLPPPEPTPEELEAQREKEMRDGFMDKYN